MTENLERAVKKHILGQPQSVLITASQEWQTGIEEEINYWLDHLYDQPKELVTVAMECPGQWRVNGLDFRNILQLSACLRQVRDIFWIVGEGKVSSVGELEKRMQKVPWELIFQDGCSVHVKSDSRSSRLFHETLIRDTAYKILGEMAYVKEQTSTDSERIWLQIRDNRLTIGLALSFQPLFQRQYKQSLQAHAPLAEHTAACLLSWLCPPAHQLVAGCKVLVPFAGSGTFALEAMSHFHKILPVFWKDFSFCRWKCFPEKSFANQVSKLKQHATPSDYNFVMSDIDPEAVLSCEKNAQSFCEPLPDLKLSYDVDRQAFFTSNPQDCSQDTLLVLLNPPFGHRMSAGRSFEFFGQLSDQLLQLQGTCHKMLGVMLMQDHKGMIQHFCENLTDKFYFQQKKLVVGGLKLVALQFSG